MTFADPVQSSPVTSKFSYNLSDVIENLSVCAVPLISDGVNLHLDDTESAYAATFNNTVNDFDF